MSETIQEEVVVTNTYTESHKKYYQANKEEILRKYKEKKPYNAFYQRNKDRLKATALKRYYDNKLKKEQEEYTIIA